MTIFYVKNYHDLYFYSKKKIKVHRDSHVGFAFILVLKVTVATTTCKSMCSCIFKHIALNK